MNRPKIENNPTVEGTYISLKNGEPDWKRYAMDLDKYIDYLESQQHPIDKCLAEDWDDEQIKQ